MHRIGFPVLLLMGTFAKVSCFFTPGLDDVTFFQGKIRVREVQVDAVAGGLQPKKAALHPALLGPWEELETNQMLIVTLIGAIESVAAPTDELLNSTAFFKHGVASGKPKGLGSPSLEADVSTMLGSTFRLWSPVLTWVQLAIKNINAIFSGLPQFSKLSLEPSLGGSMGEVQSILRWLPRQTESILASIDSAPAVISAERVKSLDSGLTSFLRIVDAFTQKLYDGLYGIVGNIYQALDRIQILAQQYKVNTTAAANGTRGPSPLEAEELAQGAGRVKHQLQDAPQAAKALTYKIYRAAWQMESAIHEAAARL